MFESARSKSFCDSGEAIRDETHDALLFTVSGAVSDIDWLADEGVKLMIWFAPSRIVRRPHAFPFVKFW